MKTRHKLRWLAVGTVAALVAGGTAYATIPSSNGSVNGCYEKRTGILRVIDAEAGAKCLSIETPISWNQQGVQGNPGPAGPQGDTGPQGPAGQGVTTSVEPPGANCAHGGSKFTSESGTTYACNGADGKDGKDGAVPSGSCGAGLYVAAVGPAGVTCAQLPKLDIVMVNGGANAPFASGAVASATCPNGYRLVGGGWGTTDAISDGADIHDYDGLDNSYDVGAAGTNPFGGRIYARAYCIKFG